MIDIVRFQWDRIYTTNYDNAIERALTQANRPFKSFNNLEHRDGLPSKRTEIIHLHGCAEKWNNTNFTRSCILSGDSYFNLDGIKHWLEEFRHDIERASIVLFVGFSTHDFHLNEVRGSGLNKEQSKEVNAKLQELVTQAEKRIRDLEPGYQARRGQQVMLEFSKFERN